MAVVIDKKYAGAAVRTTVVGSMTPTVPGVGQTFVLSDPTGWPSGGNFVVRNSVELSNEEAILCNRSGATCTVVQRGYDNTTPQTHSAGSPCEHRLDAATVTSLVSHVDGLEANPHSGVLLNNAAHDVEARHTFGSPGALGLPVTPTALTPDIVGAAGSGNNPAREDHVHNVPAAAATTVTGTNAEGAGASFARNDHNHQIGGTNHIPGAALVNKSVAAAQITDAIFTSGSSLLGANENMILVTGTDPGAVGANRLWLNTTAAKRALLIRNAANTAWEVIQSFGPGINYTPTLTNFSVGAGYNIARYRRHGRSIIVDGFIKMGAGATTNASPFAISLPFAAADNTASFPSQEFYYHAAARAFDTSGNVTWAGVGVIGSGGTLPPAPGNNRTNLSFFATGGTGPWNNTTPFTWNGPDTDSFSWFCEYEGATAEDAAFV